MSTPPVLDLDALRRLEDDLGDADVLCEFLRRYLGLLDQRIERIERALRAGDHESWADAVLSLRTSSAMAGAGALSEQVAAHQLSVASAAGWAPYRCGVEGVACLRRLAAETACQLQLFLQGADATAARPS